MRIETSAFADFEAAARAALAFVHQRVGMPVRLIMRGDDDERLALQVENEVVQASQQPLLEMVGGLLNTIRRAERSAAEDARRLEQLAAEALTDPLTQAYNRRCWDRLLASEEERCRRHGHPAAILMVDLDGLKRVNDTHGHAAGDALLIRAGAALRQAVRPHDIVARLGGDEFGILSVECDRRCGEALLARVRSALAEAHVPAAVGLAVRHASIGLAGAWEDADQVMYQAKRAK